MLKNAQIVQNGSILVNLQFYVYNSNPISKSISLQVEVFCVMARLKQANEDGAFLFSIFPGLSARLRLRLINHPAPALLLCFLFKCRIDGFLLHFIDLCIMVLSLLYHWEGAQRCRRACPGKDRRPGLCVAYCSAWRN